MRVPNRGKVLVIENSDSSTLRQFKDWWREDGLDVDVVRAHSDPLPSLDGYDALVMLGGPMMPDAVERAPWLAREREIASEAVLDGLPTLGICLGGQLLAQISGGEVTARYGQTERGSTGLNVLAAAGDDPLLHGLPELVFAIENHEDAITQLPPTAIRLMSSERYENQAFRIGQSAWGLQFHPEADADSVARWDRETLISQGVDPDQVIERARANEPASGAIWREFARRFSAVVMSAPNSITAP
jgi:GMP synthase (glutamine-hydrolysing)